MATTSIWAVKNRLDKVLHYVENPEKTASEPAATELQKVLHYAADPYKTEYLHFVSGVNCSPEIALQEMNAVKAQYGKRGGRIAYHGYQSFKPGEVTANEAHEIGMELARRLWGDRFQVLVATHTDHRHIHNHFVLNSVSFTDGKKYCRTEADYREMQRISDVLCREHGKSVIEEPGKGKHRAAHIAEQEGRPTIRSQIAADLDEIVAKSFNLNDFYKNLVKHGYTIHRRGANIKHVSVSPPGSDSRFRLDKLRGADFTEEAITERMMKMRRGELPRTLAVKPQHRHYPKRLYTPYPKIKLKGFRALYFKYLLLLGKVEKHQAPPKVQRAHRDDLIRFRQYTEQFAFLDKYRIETQTQLDRYEVNLQSLIAAMTDHRANLYRYRRRGIDTGGEIEGLTLQLRELRREIHIIERIRDKEPEIESQLKEVMRLEERQKYKDKERSIPEKNR